MPIWNLVTRCSSSGSSGAAESCLSTVLVPLRAVYKAWQCTGWYVQRFSFERLPHILQHQFQDKPALVQNLQPLAYLKLFPLNVVLIWNVSLSVYNTALSDLRCGRILSSTYWTGAVEDIFISQISQWQKWVGRKWKRGWMSKKYEKQQFVFRNLVCDWFSRNGHKPAEMQRAKFYNSPFLVWNLPFIWLFHLFAFSRRSIS